MGFLTKGFLKKNHPIDLYYGRTLLLEIANKKKIPTEPHTSIQNHMAPTGIF